jgi:hypothetical protein
MNANTKHRNVDMMKLCSENSYYHLAYKIQLPEKFLPYFIRINVIPPTLMSLIMNGPEARISELLENQSTAHISKAKFTLEEATKAQRGSRCMSLLLK